MTEQEINKNILELGGFCNILYDEYYLKECSDPIPKHSFLLSKPFNDLLKKIPECEIKDIWNRVAN